MDDRFYTAFFPGEVKVCGSILKDFTCFHYLSLSSLGSPFLNPAGTIRTGDLLIAVKACTSKFPEKRSYALKLRDVFWTWKLRRNEKRFRAECEALNGWIQRHSNRPKFWETVSGKKSNRILTGPDILIVVARLIKEMGFSEEKAWNASIGRAQWLLAESAELDGSEARFHYENEFNEEEIDHA